MDIPRQGQAPPIEATTLPDVATSAHPTAHAIPEPPGDPRVAGEEVLQGLLPEVSALANRVGGYRRLAELAMQLDRAGSGR